MVIEYVGELIRPSLADVRERRLYNDLVGCGTYVFRLNELQCVDATRVGNLAHVLNHSCDPNCYSRTVGVRVAASGQLRDHVVIFAKRDIRAGDELTYDYRFNGDEKLPCNCGAERCRGFVNVDDPDDCDGGGGGGRELVVPRSALQTAG
uniref:Histone-lysine N-methyltransferase n=1 Tax=Chlamydomonas euryale TaxID=1486919 RepID=A0A7R9Z1C3_9CHLO